MLCVCVCQKRKFATDLEVGEPFIELEMSSRTACFAVGGMFNLQEENVRPEDAEEPDVPVTRSYMRGSRPKNLEQLVRRAHEGLGHPHRERFIRILKAGKTPEEAIAIAKEMTCSICEKFQIPKAWRKAAVPRELGVNDLIGVDTVEIRYGEINLKALNVICWGSGYHVMVPLTSMEPR